MFFHSYKPFSRQVLYGLSIETSKYSKFRVDHGVDDAKVNEPYIKWMDKAMANADTAAIVVAELGGILAGVVVIIETPECHQVDKVAVNKSFYYRGVGGNLMLASMSNAQKKIARKM